MCLGFVLGEECSPVCHHQEAGTTLLEGRAEIIAVPKRTEQQQPEMTIHLTFASVRKQD